MESQGHVTGTNRTLLVLDTSKPTDQSTKLTESDQICGYQGRGSEEGVLDEDSQKVQTSRCKY